MLKAIKRHPPGLYIDNRIIVNAAVARCKPGSEKQSNENTEKKRRKEK